MEATLFGYLYTTREAAAWLKVDTSTVRRYCATEKLYGAFKENGSNKLGWRIPAASIVAVMAFGREQ